MLRCASIHKHKISATTTGGDCGCHTHTHAVHKSVAGNRANCTANSCACMYVAHVYVLCADATLAWFSFETFQIQMRRSGSSREGERSREREREKLIERIQQERHDLRPVSAIAIAELFEH